MGLRASTRCRYQTIPRVHRDHGPERRSKYVRAPPPPPLPLTTLKRLTSSLVTVADPQEYFCLGTQLFSLELMKLFILYLARTSAGTLDEKITVRTMRGYIAHTISAAYRCTGKKQLDNEERKQVYVYIDSLVRDGELSNKMRVKPVSTRNDLDLLIDAVFSDAFSLGVQSIRVVLNLALYMNLFVDVCGRGSDLAWGGPSVAEKDNHCLCWNHCHFFVVNVDDGDRVIAANIDIKYQKGMRNRDLQKTVSLRLLPANMAMHDSLRLIVTLALVDGVFGSGVTWSSILSIDPGELPFNSNPKTVLPIRFLLTALKKI